MSCFRFEELAFDAGSFVNNGCRIAGRFKSMCPAAVGHARFPCYLVVSAFNA
jgi:hypothetical protein